MGADGGCGLLVSPRVLGGWGGFPAGRSTTLWRLFENCFCSTQHNVTHHISIPSQNNCSPRGEHPPPTLNLQSAHPSDHHHHHRVSSTELLYDQRRQRRYVRSTCQRANVSLRGGGVEVVVRGGSVGGGVCAEVSTSQRRLL